MATVTPPNPAGIDDHSLRQWHEVYKTPWETLVSIGYVEGARVMQSQQQHLDLNADFLEHNLDGTVGNHVTKELDDAGEEVFAVSSDVGDTQMLAVQGINESGFQEAVAVTLTGTTPVSCGVWKNVNSAAVLGVLNLGTVSLSASPLQMQVQILPGNGLAVNSTQQIADDEVGQLENLTIGVTSKNNNAIGAVRVKAKQGGVWYQAFEQRQVARTHTQVFEVPRTLISGQKIAFVAEAINKDETTFCFQASMYALGATVGQSPIEL